MTGDCCEHCRESRNRLADIERLVQDQADAIHHLANRVESLEAWNRPIGR